MDKKSLTPLVVQPSPIVLSIAGSDSSGGAGIQADLKTFSALRTYGTTVITAITAQNTQTVDAVEIVQPELIRQQLCTLFEDINISAVKIGMLGSPETIEAVAECIANKSIKHIVLDTVMISKSGRHLLQPDAIETLKKTLLPLATLITPNLPEAACITNTAEPETLEQMQRTLIELKDYTDQSILLKGGHLEGSRCHDLLWHDGEISKYSSDRIDTCQTHGTGCTLSSAITAYLAHGNDLTTAVSLAKQYVHDAIKDNHLRIQVGNGHGPLHHFHEWW